MEDYATAPARLGLNLNVPNRQRWSWWDRKRFRSTQHEGEFRGWDSNDQMYLDEIVTQLAEAESPEATEIVASNTEDIIELMPSHQALISDVGYTLSRKRLYSKKCKGNQQQAASAFNTMRGSSQYYQPSTMASFQSNKPRSKSAKQVYLTLNQEERVVPSVVTDSRTDLEDVADNDESEFVRVEILPPQTFCNPIMEEQVQSMTIVDDEESVSTKSETIRRMPSAMPVKRKFRSEFYRRQISHLPYMQRVTYEFVREFKRQVSNFDEFCQHFFVWHHDLKRIEGNYGTSVLAYFTFVRLLFLLNSFSAILFILFVIVPGSIRSFGLCPLERISRILSSMKNESENITLPIMSADCFEVSCLDVETKNAFQVLLDFLKGTGWMTDKLLFIGTYHSFVAHNVGKAFYNLNLAYMLVTFIFLLVSLISMGISIGSGVKYAIVTPDDRYQRYFSKIFAGWDYCIRNVHVGFLKQRIFRRDILNQIALDKDNLRRQIRDENQNEKMSLYLKRAAVALLNCFVIIGSFFVIYFVTDGALMYANKERKKSLNAVVSLIIEYLPPVTITFLNFVVPNVLCWFSSIEDYRSTIEIRLALIKTVFLRLATVIVLVLTVILQTVECYESLDEGGNQKPYRFTLRNIRQRSPVDGELPSYGICGEMPHCKCWETYMGQQFYKLAILNFFVTIVSTFCVDLPRKIIVARFSNKLTQIIGRQKFEIPSNVLDIVYTQTLCWLGCFYCPFLPLITCLELLIVFYLKKFTLLYVYDLSKKPYKTTKTHAFFVSILLVSYFMSLATFGFAVVRLRPSAFCGPFRSLGNMWIVIVEFIDMLPQFLRRILRLLTWPPFKLFLVFVFSVSAFYFHAIACASKNLVGHLKLCLIYEGRDRLFLVESIKKIKHKQQQQK